MKSSYRSKHSVVLLAAVLSVAAASGVAVPQDYSIVSHTIAGGGGVSSGGVYSVDGAIAEPFADAELAGGVYALAPGFRPMVVEATGSGLSIVRTGPNTLSIRWKASAGAALERSGDLLTVKRWAPMPGPVTTDNGFNEVTVTVGPGVLFYRVTAN